MPQKSNRWIYIAMGSIVLILIVALGLFSILNKSGNSTGPGKAENHPDASYSGLEKLTDRGITIYQINDLKHALEKYNDGANMEIKEIKLDPDSIDRIPPARDSVDQTNTYNFTLDMDGTKYRTKMLTINITTIRLYLYDSKGSQLFDSNVVDVNPAE